MNRKITEKKIRQSAIKIKTGKNQWYVATWSDRLGMYLDSHTMTYSAAVAVVRSHRQRVAEGYSDINT